MRTLSAILVVLQYQFANAHYSFSRLSHNSGPLSSPFYYVRNLTAGYAYAPPPHGYEGIYVPYYDIYSPNHRCGRGATKHGPGTQTLSVQAGDKLAFHPTITSSSGVEEDTTVSHEGPGLAYLSKVEGGDLEAYEGDGDWFKIGSISALNDTRWALMSQPSMDFTIPKTTPPGKYLMRVEHVFPFSPRFNVTQYYVSCAHLDISGPGGGKPGPMVKFPGAYDVWDHAIWVPWHIGNLKVSNLTGYVPPGPPVWEG